MVEIEIKKVEKDTPLTTQLLDFVENCSWYDAKEHIAMMIKEWVFTDWETVFVAMKDGKIIGMTSLMKTDYYPLPEIFPWVSCVFVSEECRGNRVSEKLICFANEYAKTIGFNRTYIPTEFTGLYERYGYVFLKNVVNFGGGTDRLYFKDI